VNNRCGFIAEAQEAWEVNWTVGIVIGAALIVALILCLALIATRIHHRARDYEGTIKKSRFSEY
jgi:heme/copper-type cytochrome/quinol oxidase subunit 2